MPDTEFDWRPYTRNEVANGLLADERGRTIRHASKTVAANVTVIAVIALVCYGVTGVWVPPWWAALLIGVSIPDPVRAARDLVLIARHRMTFYTDICDGSFVSGCGCHEIDFDQQEQEEVRG
jgi:hypothetical protein